VKYAREDRAETPRFTRLARALAEAERLLAAALPQGEPPADERPAKPADWPYQETDESDWRAAYALVDSALIACGFEPKDDYPTLHDEALDACAFLESLYARLRAEGEPPKVRDESVPPAEMAEAVEALRLFVRPTIEEFAMWWRVFDRVRGYAPAPAERPRRGDTFELRPGFNDWQDPRTGIIHGRTVAAAEQPQDAPRSEPAAGGLTEEERRELLDCIAHARDFPNSAETNARLDALARRFGEPAAGGDNPLGRYPDFTDGQCRVALANISGALMDAGVVVPSSPLDYGAALRALLDAKTGDVQARIEERIFVEPDDDDELHCEECGAVLDEENPAHRIGNFCRGEHRGPQLSDAQAALAELGHRGLSRAAIRKLAEQYRKTAVREPK
jgi:hypothetical protein